MTKVITYGTYDLLHYGHIRLLERAKKLGDYLIVGITSDDFDKSRGKINVQQTLMERVEAVRTTGIADEIIIEEYEGQKIDDIMRYNIDIFTVGSDWKGEFDYLKTYCKVVYLERTQGISSSELRTEKRKIRIGIVGESDVVRKYVKECEFVNGIEINGICTQNNNLSNSLNEYEDIITQDYEKMLGNVDAVYLISEPMVHYEQIKLALLHKKHILCEMPIALMKKQAVELHLLAERQGCVLMDAIKTAYSTAYSRLLLLAKTGKIGKVVSIDSTATSLKEICNLTDEWAGKSWNSICAWGPTALLPIFQLLGTDYKEKKIISKLLNKEKMFDGFTKVDLIYDDAVASIKVGKAVKSEGELIISGTKGYIYVPAPWWKTDYFEIRYENIMDNKRYFYQLDGEGIRYQLIAFINAINIGKKSNYIDEDVSISMCQMIEDFYRRKDFVEI